MTLYSFLLTGITKCQLRSGREGMIDSTPYFLAYFYPRVAVYDDYNGMGPDAFMESHEFYKRFQ
jgi:hypothetical protein